MTKVWVLSRGCRYEGGSVDAVYATEEAGLAAAEKYMAEDIARTARSSSPEDPCRTYFEKRPNDRGNHYWIEHYCWFWKQDDGTLKEQDGGSDYLSLAWYELQ